MIRMFLITVSIFLILALPKNIYAERLVIADFDTATYKNNLGDEFGVWGSDPMYCIVWIRDSFDQYTKHGDKGNSLRLEYDIDTENNYSAYSDVTNPSEEAYNGFWMKMGKVNTEGFDKLVFFIKGDETTGYTSRIRLDIRSLNNELGRYLITGITNEWKRVVIPFSNRTGIKDWSRLAEFNIKFDTANCDKKVGTIYIDDIYLSNE